MLLYDIDKFDAPRTMVANDMDFLARIIHKYHAPIGVHLCLVIFLDSYA